MTDTTESLRRKLHSAQELKSVVRTMKALAASSISQYEKAVCALADYYETVQFGLSVCFREQNRVGESNSGNAESEFGTTGVVVFGSDQGLVGRFNEVVVDYAATALSKVSRAHAVWAVGERAYERLLDVDLVPKGLFKVPSSVKAISTLVGEILVEFEPEYSRGTLGELTLFYNHPTTGAAYSPGYQRLLPIDDEWVQQLMSLSWPTEKLPEVIGARSPTLRLLIREYLFVSLYRAAAESLASENASRLAAMQRAEKNIDELLEELTATFHRLRQSGIDAELFDSVAGFEALTTKRARRGG